MKQRNILEGVMRRIPVWASVLLFLVSTAATGAQRWQEKGAVVRAVVEVSKPARAVACDILWRLPFDVPAARGEAVGGRVSVYRISDGMKVENFYVREVSSDRAILAFEAENPGGYAVYYNPEGGARPSTGDLAQWKKQNRPENYPDYSRMPRAEMTGIDFRDAGVGGPYDAAATVTEADAYFSRAKGAFEAYFVPAEYPLNPYGRIPLVWVVPEAGKQVEDGFFARLFGKKSQTAPREDTVRLFRGGKALVQLGLVGTGKTACRVTVRHSSVPGAGVSIGVAGEKEVELAPRQMRGVWLVAEASDSAVIGAYDVFLRVEDGRRSIDVPFVLKVMEGAPGGQSEIRAGFVSGIGKSVESVPEPDEVNPRFPVAVYGDYQVRSAENVLAINPVTALPLQIYSAGEALLADPMLLVFATPNGVRKIGVKDIRFLRRDGGVQVWRGTVRTHDMVVGLQASLSAYGLVRYEIDVEALSSIDFRNIWLEAGFSGRVTEACYDTVKVEGNATLSFSPRDGFTGLWLGGAGGGVFVQVDADPANAFYASPGASVDLYKGTRTGLIVGTGPMGLEKGRKIALRCSMQLLPADYSPAQARGRNIYLAPDAVPGVEEVGSADLLALENPFALLEEGGDAAAARLFDAGVPVVVSVDPFALPSYSFWARALASMGYGYALENGGRTMRFEATDAIIAAMEYLYGRILSKSYVGGVLLAPSAYNMERIRGYSLRRTVSVDPFLVMLREKGRNASLLGEAPWMDAVLTDDALGVGRTECHGELGGLTEYFRIPDGASPDVLEVLSLPGRVYADGADSVSAARTQRLWAVRKALGLDAPGTVFFPQGSVGSPVRSPDPSVRISSYAMPGEVVAVLYNISAESRSVVPEFDFASLGVERWRVDGLERVLPDGLEKGQMILLDDPVQVPAGGVQLLRLRWPAGGKDSGEK